MEHVLGRHEAGKWCFWERLALSRDLDAGFLSFWRIEHLDLGRTLRHARQLSIFCDIPLLQHFIVFLLCLVCFGPQMTFQIVQRLLELRGLLFVLVVRRSQAVGDVL